MVFYEFSPKATVRSSKTYPVTLALLHAANMDRLHEKTAFLNADGFWDAGPEGDPWPLAHATYALLTHARLRDDGTLWKQNLEMPRLTENNYKLAAVELVDGTRIAVAIVL